MKQHTSHRRVFIRSFSFMAAGLLVMGGFTYLGYSTASRYKTSLENAYHQALDDLSTYLSNIENALTKSLYAASPAQMTLLSSKLWRETSCAKAALSQLPLGEVQLEAVYRFLSQAGDYAMALSNKTAAGESITEEDYENLSSLKKYAASLNAQVQDAEADLLQQSMEKQPSVLLTQNTEVVPGMTDGFRDMEEGFTDYPTLIYDGPFSDHIMRQAPRATEGKGEYSEEEALRAAGQFLGRLQSEGLKRGQDGEGHMPVYSFENDSFTVDVTKKGGFIARVINTRSIGAARLSIEEAVKNARIFLESHGYTDMRQSYFSAANGVCTVNFAYTQGEVTCYPDLIKVGVGLDTGDIVLFDATGYLMNHQDRTFGEPAITTEDARAKLSPALRPVDSHLAVIPSAGLSERYCYEFLCRGEGEEEVLVYIDANTGREQQILILLKADNGEFAM